MNSWNKTIQTYNTFRQDFVSKTRSDITWVKADRISKTLSFIEKKHAILELWTWPWREADHFESLWYTVIRSDVIDWFIEYNNSNGKDTLKLDVLDFELKEKYHMIFANAVLLHFNLSEFNTAIHNISNTLLPWWYLSCSMKKWTWEWHKKEKLWWERFYKYRDSEALEQNFLSHGLQLQYKHETNFHWTDWIFIIVQK